MSTNRPTAPSSTIATFTRSFTAESAHSAATACSRPDWVPRMSRATTPATASRAMALTRVSPRAISSSAVAASPTPTPSPVHFAPAWCNTCVGARPEGRGGVRGGAQGIPENKEGKLDWGNRGKVLLPGGSPSLEGGDKDMEQGQVATNRGQFATDCRLTHLHEALNSARLHERGAVVRHHVGNDPRRLLGERLGGAQQQNH
eukprot:4902387-Pyramimonas_sp.AAC.1